MHNIRRVPLVQKKTILLLFCNNISRASAVSSTNFGSILIFASCVVGTCKILCGWVNFALFLTPHTPLAFLGLNIVHNQIFQSMDLSNVLSYSHRQHPAVRTGTCSKKGRLELQHDRAPPARRWCARAIRPPYRGKPPYSIRVMSAIFPRRAKRFWSPYTGTPPCSDRLIGGPPLLCSHQLELELDSWYSSSECTAVDTLAPNVPLTHNTEQVCAALLLRGSKPDACYGRGSNFWVKIFSASGRDSWPKIVGIMPFIIMKQFLKNKKSKHVSCCEFDKI